MIKSKDLQNRQVVHVNGDADPPAALLASPPADLVERVRAIIADAERLKPDYRVIECGHCFGVGREQTLAILRASFGL
jgi:hypothetical protein